MKKTELENTLLLFSYKEENRKEAEEAFVKVYREYSRYIQTIVKKAKSSYPNYYDDIVDIVVSNTFLKIYNKPLSFKILDEDSDELVDKKFKGYLAKIAKNNFKDLLKINRHKEEHLLKIDDNDDDFEPKEVKGTEQRTLSENQKVLQELLLTFKERDRLILLSLYQYHEEGRKRPKEIRQWLAKVHNTSEDNIRKIKSRCDAKIREHFEKHTNLKSLKR